MKTTKVQKSKQALHPFSVPLKVWSQIGIKLLHLLKELHGYKYIVTAVYYTSAFVEAEPLKEKDWGCGK